jgi:hypothetical protein
MPSLTSRALGLGLFVFLAGCPSGSNGPGADTGPAVDTGVAPGVDAGRDAFAPFDSGAFSASCQTLTFPRITVPDGVEHTQCVILDLGNELPMHVGSIHNVLGTGSHHFIVYRASASAVETTTPFDCQPFVDTLTANSGSPLMITQRSDETLTLPPGVAYTVPAHQLMRLELHYLNLTGGPVDLSPTSTLCPIPDAEYHDDADFLFIGNPDVDVQPHQVTTLGPTFYRLDSHFSDAHFFALTGHTHQLGTNVVVQTGPAAAGPFVDVYDVANWSWREPETVYPDVPFQIPPGGGFSFTCTWDNPTDATLHLGESAETNEMCFFWAYYYPAHPNAAHVCIHTARGGAAGTDICCPGSSLCSLLGL